MNQNYNEQLEKQEKELVERYLEGIEIWKEYDNDFKSAYNRFIEKLNPEGQNDMIIFNVFLSQTDFKNGVTKKHVFKQLEKWGYAKHTITEYGSDTIICKKPYTDMRYIALLDMYGNMRIDEVFVISEEVAKKLKECFQQ